jgi:hypothetical protein
MLMCAYGTCREEFPKYEMGAANRKYCAKHSKVVRSFKKKQYDQAYKARMKGLRAEIKSELEMKCMLCGTDIHGYSLSKKYCDDCALISKKLHAETIARNRKIQNAFKKVSHKGGLFWVN